MGLKERYRHVGIIIGTLEFDGAGRWTGQHQPCDGSGRLHFSISLIRSGVIVRVPIGEKKVTARVELAITGVLGEGKTGEPGLAGIADVKDFGAPIAATIR